jgi:GNAT superfamily N-acetyltransferase
VEAARPATADDIPRVAELARQALAELAPGRGGEMFVLKQGRREPVDEGLRAALEDPDHALWVGTIDDTVLGYAAARVDGLPDGTVLGVIDDLYVEPEARSVGVGEALMGVVLEWCRERGSRGIDAMALPGDRQTKNFFEANGFTARLLLMHHDERPREVAG